MTKFMDKSFSTFAPGDDSYRDNWERTFVKKATPNAGKVQAKYCPYHGDYPPTHSGCPRRECPSYATPTPRKALCGALIGPEAEDGEYENGHAPTVATLRERHRKLVALYDVPTTPTPGKAEFCTCEDGGDECEWCEAHPVRRAAPTPSVTEEDHYCCIGCGETPMPSWGMTCCDACKALVCERMSAPKQAAPSSGKAENPPTICDGCGLHPALFCEHCVVA